VAFVTRLRPGPLPNQAACQLPDLPTTVWVGLPPTGDPRRWGAHNIPTLKRITTFVFYNIPGSFLSVEGWSFVFIDIPASFLCFLKLPASSSLFESDILS
jgi:hypothetical protein